MVLTSVREVFMSQCNDIFVWDRDYVVWFLPLLEKFSLVSALLVVGEIFIFFPISMLFSFLCLLVRILSYYDLIINLQATREFQFLQKCIIFVFFWILEFLVCPFFGCCFKSYPITMVGLFLDHSQLSLVTSIFRVTAYEIQARQLKLLDWISLVDSQKLILLQKL